jgi:hypothetical protein
MDSVYKQLDYLAEQVGQLEERMIDPVQFGEFKGAVTALKSEVDQIKKNQATMDEKLDLVLTKLSEAKGGWKLLLALGGAASTAGAIITWVATHTFTIGPR